MPAVTGIDAVRRYIDAINAHDVVKIMGQLTDEHVLMDSLGEVTYGSDALAAAWTRYFAMFPDYHITTSDMFQAGNVVGVFGTASGTLLVDGKRLAENKWEVPASWRAIVHVGAIASWQIYADNEPVRRLMHRAGVQ